MLFSCALLGTVAAQDFKPRYSNNFDFGLSYTAGRLRQSLDGLNNYTDDFVGLQFNYIGLFHLTPKVALGFGTGVRHVIEVGEYLDSWVGYDDQDFINSYFSIPLYAHARFRFLDRRVSPFLSTSIGYQFRVGENTHLGEFNYGRVEGTSSLSSGLLANVQAGISIHVGSKFNIMAGPYFEYRQATSKYSYMTYDEGDASAGGRERDMNFFEAGLKVGFAF